MTGRELRAQLRAQQERNTGAPEVTARGDELRFRQWHIRFPNLRPVEIWFTPEATRAEALTTCDGAVDAVPMHNSPKRPATGAEADELRALIAAILANATGRERAEAVESALADPIEALRCYRLLAGDR